MTADDRPLDHVPPGETAEPNASALEDNIKSRSTWLRLAFMVVFAILDGLTPAVIFAVVVLQFFWVLFTSEPNEKLTAFGHSLAQYTREINDYLTYYTEERPFPFDRDWPQGD